MSKLQDLEKELKELGTPQRAKASSWYFKTGKGQYGEGDVFIGITVPQMRSVAKKYLDLTLVDVRKLLASKIHEYRLVALIILVSKYQNADEKEKEGIYNFYIDNRKGINNWDLVDLSAGYIVGDYLSNRNKSILYKLAKSKKLWDRRIAIVSTSKFISNNKFYETFKIAEILMADKHDLIHKAVGWMLREVGKRDQKTEETFLKKYYKIMPRTMLRYAIEKFEPTKRTFYMIK